MKQGLQPFRSICCAYKSLRCLDLEIWRFWCPQTDRQTTRLLYPLLHMCGGNEALLCMQNPRRVIIQLRLKAIATRLVQYYSSAVAEVTEIHKGSYILKCHKKPNGTLFSTYKKERHIAAKVVPRPCPPGVWVCTIYGSMLALQELSLKLLTFYLKSSLLLLILSIEKSPGSVESSCHEQMTPLLEKKAFSTKSTRFKRYKEPYNCNTILKPGS
jgi:hypothetical protein